MLLNEIDPRHKDFVYINFMKSGKVQSAKLEESTPVLSVEVDVRIISGNRFRILTGWLTCDK